MQRIIALLDLDYFFAQCEILRKPDIKGKPVVIVIPTVRENSGAVATCNYEARNLKIRSAMPLSLAKKLANKETTFINADKDYYTQVSDTVFGIVDLYSEKVEQVSVDEAYFDLSSAQGFEKAIETVEKIKQRIRSETGLTCSIGLATNKLIAKMASEEKKPDGFFVVKESEVQNFIKQKQVGKLFGLGPKSEEALSKIGVKTISELQNVSKEELLKLFGNARGEQFFNFARGIDEREVTPNREKKQISRMITLSKDSSDFNEMKENVSFLCERVYAETIKLKKKFKTASIIIITPKFETITKSKTFVESINTLEELRAATEGLLQDYLSTALKSIRRLGVRVSNFEDAYGYQKKLFDFGK